jgi:hypothetical protein
MKRIDFRSLRVPGGITVVLLVAALIVLSCSAFADAPKKLLAADTEAWDFAIVVESGDAPLVHDFSLCRVTSAAKVSLPAAAAQVLRDPLVCADGFALLPAPPAPAIAETIVTFNDGTSSASFTLPALGVLPADVALKVRRPIVSDDVEGSWITVIPTYDRTPLYVVLRDARDVDAPPIVETFKASRPITQHRIEARGVFWASIAVGTDPTYRCFPSSTCSVYGDIYWFASTGTPAGGSFRVSSTE